jgi:MFS superfamily sulfate permease-like transporter
MNPQQTAASAANSGVKAQIKADTLSGFFVFLLALPLSLGIAKASGFPPAMGVLTAMVGGLFVSFFKVGQMTIKGPAAGLITICAASIAELGWEATSGVIVVMAIIQFLIGVFKLGSFSDFFPHSAVHGMLAAIGIIIIAKQIPVLLGDEPSLYAGEGPVELLLDIPRFVSHAHWHIGIVGLVSLLILFLQPRLRWKVLKAVPGPMVVLLIAVPLSMYWHFSDSEPAYSLVHIGDFWGSLGLHAEFSSIGTFAFWKYVMMFLFVNSLESLLTVKAVDGLDPQGRKADPSSDLTGLAAGNAVAGLLGGLPMISEVVRSSANVGFGGQTKWSNFFHGVFLLLAMLLVIPWIELIPNAALSAMLIYAGFRLASPKEFKGVYAIGTEQLTIFLVTIAVTLLEDLLLGVAAGIVVKLVFHLTRGVRFNELFRTDVDVERVGSITHVTLNGAAVFTNILGHQKIFQSIPLTDDVVLHVEAVDFIDHSFLEVVHRWESDVRQAGRRFIWEGEQGLEPLSDHPLAARKRQKP